jgi:hypothetical protein
MCIKRDCRKRHALKEMNCSPLNEALSTLNGLNFEVLLRLWVGSLVYDNVFRAAPRNPNAELEDNEGSRGFVFGEHIH